MSTQQLAEILVHCQLAESEIPKSVCLEEQGDEGCRGCRASTRKCVKCGSSKGIADPKVGLCATCHGRALRSVTDLKIGLPGGSVADALEDLTNTIDLVGTDGDVEGLEAQNAKMLAEDNDPANVLARPKILQQGDTLLAILGEHIQEKNGERIVSAPIVVLRTRARLIAYEAEEALQKMISRGYVERVDRTWNTIRILATDIPELPGSFRASSGGSHAGKAGTPRPRILTVGSIIDVESTLPTVAEIYSELHRRHMVIDGEKIIRGAVPHLQLAFKVGSGMVQQFLERLQEEKRIAQKDGWRSIVLLSEEFEDERPALGDRQLSALRKSIARAKIRLKKGMGAAQAIGETVDAIEESLVGLRQAGGIIAEQITSLEAVLADLRKAKRQVDEADAIAEQVLPLATMLAENLETSGMTG